MSGFDANEWVIDNHDFISDLGVSIESQEERHVRFSLVYDESLTNPQSEAMQGGVVATLIDHTASAAVRTTLQTPLETSHTTTDLNVSYLRPADTDIVADAMVVRSGGSTAVVTVDVERETDSELIAVGRCTFRVFR